MPAFLEAGGRYIQVSNRIVLPAPREFFVTIVCPSPHNLAVYFPFVCIWRHAVRDFTVKICIFVPLFAAGHISMEFYFFDVARSCRACYLGFYVFFVRYKPSYTEC